MENGRDLKQAVKEHYAGLVGGSGCGCGSGCCGPAPALPAGFGSANYTRGELAGVPAEAAVHSYGCGNPLAFAGVQEGDTVVDIGSGAGLDAIMAARRVGPAGRVIGLDMTPEMIQRAEENVRRAGLTNVEFVLGEAEEMPLPARTADWVISNCVINLSPDKERVFREIHRILKPGGRLLISDMVAENLPGELLDSFNAWAGCLAGAIPEQDYVAAAVRAGLQDVRVVDRVDYDLSIARPYLEERFPGEADAILRDLAARGTRVSSIRLSANKPAAL